MINCPYCQAPLMLLDQFCTTCGRPRPVNMVSAQPALGATSYFPPLPRPSRTKKILGTITIGLVTVAIIIGATIFVYAATRPTPVLTLTSDYHVNGMAIGATSTVLHLQGQHFSGNEAITFILDGQELSGIAPVQSDSHGAFTVVLPIGQDWTPGKHVMTATDADHYLTKQGVQFVVVAAGQANTPGPNGAPTDSSSFKINASFTGTILETGNPDSSHETLTITGTPGPAGGTVCGEHEDGLPFVMHNTFGSGNLAGTPYTETFVQTCTGTYQGGKLTETVTVTSQYLAYMDSYSNNVVCSPSVPYVLEQIQGIFSNATAITGSYNMASAKLTCTSSFETITQYGEAGPWNGYVVV